MSGHFLGKSCSFGLPYALFALFLFVTLVVSHFGFNGGTMVLIAPVPGHCLPFAFQAKIKIFFTYFCSKHKIVGTNENPESMFRTKIRKKCFAPVNFSLKWVSREYKLTGGLKVT